MMANFRNVRPTGTASALKEPLGRLHASTVAEAVLLLPTAVIKIQTALRKLVEFAICTTVNRALTNVGGAGIKIVVGSRSFAGGPLRLNVRRIFLRTSEFAFRERSERIDAFLMSS